MNTGIDHIQAHDESAEERLVNAVGGSQAAQAWYEFVLWRASSGEFLLRHLGDVQSQVFAVPRTSDVKFRKPARGALRGSARFIEGVADSLSAELSSRGRALVSVLLEIADPQGVVTMTGQYDWFLQRQTDAN